MKYLTTLEVAHELKVSKQTLLNWLYAGKIPEPPRNRKGYRLWSPSRVTLIRKLIGRAACTRGPWSIVRPSNRPDVVAEYRAGSEPVPARRHGGSRRVPPRAGADEPRRRTQGAFPPRVDRCRAQLTNRLSSPGLVSTDWLAAHLDDPSLRIVDVRWYLDPARQGRAEYEAGHIPGAIFLDVSADLSAPGGGRGGARAATRGRRPSRSRA